MTPDELYKTREDPFKVRATRGEYVKTEVIQQHLRKYDGGKVLDLGCGEGLFTEIYSENIGGEFYACDVSSTAIERAMFYKSDVKYFQYDLTKGYPEKYLRHKFDLILCSEVLYYLPVEKATRVVRNITSFGKKGSVLVVVVSQELSENDVVTMFEPYYDCVGSYKYKCLKKGITNIIELKQR